MLAIGWAAPIAAGQSAVRELPPVYGGGVTSITVLITINSPQGATVGLEDLPPNGWPVTYISPGGSLDPQNGKVKWVFFGNAPGSVSYILAVPGSASGPACFDGDVSFNGPVQDITGDACVYGPVPAASAWGLLGLGLSILIGGTLLLRKDTAFPRTPSGRPRL
ncbi:MAG: hypothetical protein Q7R41_05070 [Phycisphaerales bacterium]|nr:hypothetical protein [Phycisphaerales bacterium]